MKGNIDFSGGSWILGRNSQRGAVTYCFAFFCRKQRWTSPSHPLDPPLDLIVRYETQKSYKAARETFPNRGKHE